jgi:hypothetical protein
MLLSSKKLLRNRRHDVATGGCARSARDVLVRTRNSGENEANFSHRRIRRKNNLPKNLFVDANVSRGQMGDKIVAIRDEFC